MKRSRGTGTNAFLLIVLMFAAILLAYYATVALTSRDPLWFLEGFTGEPARIIVYHDAQRREFLPGQAGFAELATAVQVSLSQGFARLTQVGLSEQSLQDAYTKHVTLEVLWDRPVVLHTWFPAGRVTQMLFPITGRHSELSVVFLGDDGVYRAGAPALETMDPIREALLSLGLP
jgi:hypothetical protein